MTNELKEIPQYPGLTGKPKLYLVQKGNDRRLVFAYSETIEYLKSQGAIIYSGSVVGDLHRDTIDPNNPPPPLTYLIEFHNNNGTVVNALSLGNFSNVYGKPKAGKGWTIAFLMSIILGSPKEYGRIRKINLEDRFREVNPEYPFSVGTVAEIRERIAAIPKIRIPIPKKTTVLLIDTEQSEADVWSEMQRAIAAAGSPELKLEAITLRTRSAKERLQEIKIKLFRRTDIAFVVLDGGVDLVQDPNDLEEAKTILMDELVPIITDLDIHLVNVLHENKNNNELRGMFGLIAQQKGELSLNVLKDPNNEYQSIISAGGSSNRRRAFDPFTISYIDDIPRIVENEIKPRTWQGNTAKEKKQWLSNPENNDSEVSAGLAKKVFEGNEDKELLIGDVKNKLAKVLDDSSRNSKPADVTLWFNYFHLTKKYFRHTNESKNRYGTYALNITAVATVEPIPF